MTRARRPFTAALPASERTCASRGSVTVTGVPADRTGAPSAARAGSQDLAAKLDPVLDIGAEKRHVDDTAGPFSAA